MDMSGKTQIARKDVSVPTRWIVNNVKLSGSVLHFGEGKAFQDTERIRQQSLVTNVVGYDPNSPIPEHRVLPHEDFDYGVSNYVFNVLPNSERWLALHDLMDSVVEAIVSVRLDKVKGQPFQDGVITSIGTFQTQLTAAEWVAWFANNASGWDRVLVDVLKETKDYLIVSLV